MAGFGQIKFTAFLVGDETAYDSCVVRDLGESVYLHFGIYDFEGNAGDIEAWAEEEGVPCIRRQFTAILVPGPIVDQSADRINRAVPDREVREVDIQEVFDRR